MKRAALVAAVVLLGTFGATAAAQAPRGRISGKVSDTSGLPLPGVTVALTHEAQAPLVVHTDEVGGFSFNVPYGRYTLTADLSGFRSVVRPNLAAGAEPLTVDLVLELGGFAEQTQVVAQAPRVFTSRSRRPRPRWTARSSRWPRSRGCGTTRRFRCCPGPFAGPTVSSASPARGRGRGRCSSATMRETDPFSGEPRLSLPITAIDNVQEYSPLPPAEAGPATGGVTVVNTRAGVDSYSFSVLGLFPRPRLSGGGTFSTIEAWQPTFGVSGPIVPGRVWLAQSVEYRYERFQTDTVVGRAGQQPARLVLVHAARHQAARVAPRHLAAARLAGLEPPLRARRLRAGGHGARPRHHRHQRRPDRPRRARRATARWSRTSTPGS